MAEEQICEQNGMKECIDLFTNEPEKEGKPRNKNNTDKQENRPMRAAAGSKGAIARSFRTRVARFFMPLQGVS